LAQHDQGPIEPSFALHNLAFLVTPSPTQQKEIEKLLAEQQDPRSPNYHNWLTPEQYGARFGLSANDVKKITSWLRAQGFTAISVVRSANLITFSGTVAQVQVTFRTQIHRFDADGEQRFSNVSAPVIPAALSGIVTGVRGLNNYRLKPMVQRIRPDYAANNSFTEGVNKTV
jgi:subtilase family serine protease